VSDRCDNGFCAGKMVDMCVERAVNCSLQLPNECNNPGVCDPRSGECSLPIPISGRDCNDGDPTTHNDSCIDGACIGRSDWQNFLTLGQGECTDRDGNRMPSYSGDVTEEKDCQDVCLSDRQCVGFSFSPPVCRIYGTIRTEPPPNYQWSFQGGTVPTAVVLEKALSVTGQRTTVCRKKDLKGDVASTDNSGKVGRDSVFKPMVLAIFFTATMLIFFSIPIYKCVRTCFCGPRIESDLIAQSPDGDEVISYSNTVDTTYPSSMPDSQDLRRTSNLAWEPWEPHSADRDPVSPAGLPPQYMVPPEPPESEEVIPGQVSSPLALPPSPDNNVLLPSAAAEETPSPAPQRWQRKGGRTKTTEGAQPAARSQTGGTDGTVNDPDVAPATLANAALVGHYLM